MPHRTRHIRGAFVIIGWSDGKPLKRFKSLYLNTVRIREMNEVTNMRLCLKAVMLWEALRGKGYSRLDLEDEADTVAMMYAMLYYRGGAGLTLEGFSQSLQADQARALRLAEHMVALLMQAGSVPVTALDLGEGAQETAEDQAQEGTGVYLGKMATMLIAEGWSASYVLYQMELWELTAHIQACVHKKREAMERDRLWVYHLMLPHIDSQKIRSPREMHPFPWERAEQEQEAQEQDEFLRLLSQGKIRTEQAEQTDEQ